jgi:mannose-6-phosphate isomerase
VSAAPTTPEPFPVEPIFVPRIWGASSLEPLYPEKSNLAEPIGEVWLTGVDCTVTRGPFSGRTLGEAWREMPFDWRGTRFAEPSDFPILVKFIFPKDKLSIQVHPDDAYAAAHEQAAGGRGKTEMWHAVQADPGARVLVGLIPKVDKEKFIEAIHRQTLEELFVHRSVQRGDTFFVPAGTPHTIGTGMVLCEIQEYSDLTYRVYDYGRVDTRGKPRELHLQKALEVIHFGSTAPDKVSPLFLPTEGAKHSLLAACRYFAAERCEFVATVQAESCFPCLEVLVILEGTGYFHWRGRPLMYQRGQCWLIPASLGRFSLQPEQKSVVIRTYVPDLEALRADLLRCGISEEEIGRRIFA